MSEIDEMYAQVKRLYEVVGEGLHPEPTVSDVVDAALAQLAESQAREAVLVAAVMAAFIEGFILGDETSEDGYPLSAESHAKSCWYGSNACMSLSDTEQADWLQDMLAAAYNVNKKRLEMRSTQDTHQSDYTVERRIASEADYVAALDELAVALSKVPAGLREGK